MGGGGSYRRALASPGALRFCAAGLAGRMQIGMVGLGTVLLVASITGRYGLAGEVAAAGSAGYSLLSPLTARLADRFGQGRVLPPLTLFYAASTAGLLAGVRLHAPGWALMGCSGLAGAATPQLGSMVRARWSALLGGSPLLQAAFSLESVADEVIFVTGPVLVTVLATEVHPASGLELAAATCVAGSLLLAVQRATEPPVIPAGAARGARGLLLPARGLVTLAPVGLFFGAMLAAIDLATVAFAQEHGHKPLAGFLLGGYALGSAASGLWYGSRTWRASLRRRFTLTLGAAAAGTATFWAMPGLTVLAVVMLCSGLAVSPMLISGFSLIERQAPPNRRTEAMSWLTSAISVGTAVGSAAAGQIIDTAGARGGYACAAACAVAALATCLFGLGRLSVPGPAPASIAHADIR
ncbi:MFS transporter [Actinoallomurus iriomotensis]|uniref:MFS transporter n=2 Tax=Actinoallomurus iriomotensis TaxID=478107 RepID=A0A9W6S7I6_9ACTN|nr:MFS transporter [Actinoallomurus iriomotensis]